MENTIFKSSLALSLLASSFLLANDSFVNSVGINLGKSYSDFSQTNNNGLWNKPDKSFNSVEIYSTLNPILQICKDNSMRPYISYTYSQNSDLKHQYLLVGVNKYYNSQTTKLEFYAGVLGGYGQVDWRYNPLIKSFNKNVDANSFIGGIQAGTTYPINEKFSLNLNAKYLVHNYETNLITSVATNTIEHDSTTSLGFGLEYSF